MTAVDGTETALDPTYIREHDREVLEFLSQNPSSKIGFQGLKRRLGIHPEQLSRALRRLGVDGFVEQTDLGYRVTGKGMSILNMEATAEDSPGFTVIQAHMPGDVDVRSLVAGLKGSWIGPLRWEGLTESPDELRLLWTTEDGKLFLEALISGGQLIVSARVIFQERIDEAIRLGHMLFQHVTRFSHRDGSGNMSA